MTPTEITFEAFPKIPRLSRSCVISEKLDGTNAQIIITEDGQIGAASRSRLIVPGDDNYGFAAWVQDNREELRTLGPGRHFGEWWGKGIQRSYGLEERRFSLFNAKRWHSEVRPSCCDVVPLISEGVFDTSMISDAIAQLAIYGSFAVPGWMKPEGIVIYHVQSGQLFKKLLENDDIPKGNS